MDLPAEVVQQLADIQSAVDDVEQHLQAFLEAGPTTITEQLTPLERVKTHLCLAQAAVVLYTLGRQLDAAKLDKHPVQKELERLSKYEAKVQQAVAADNLARTKPGASLNIDAANRFIDAAIPDLTSKQKAALRSRSKRPAPESGAREIRQGKIPIAKSRDAKRSQQQESKQPSRQVPDQFLQELVSEIVEGQEQPVDGTQSVDAQHTAEFAQDADALIQQVIASLDDIYESGLAR